LTTENRYETFYGHLWRAYKDRFPLLMKALGLDVSFLFGKDVNFERGTAELLAQRLELEDLVTLMRANREFQTWLGNYRNLWLEHRTHPADQRALDALYRPDSAATMFDNVWQAVENYVVLYTKAHMPPTIHLSEIAEADRNPDCPVRFQFHILNLPGASTS
jgi:hypothetical protein